MKSNKPSSIYQSVGYNSNLHRSQSQSDNVWLSNHRTGSLGHLSRTIEKPQCLLLWQTAARCRKARGIGPFSGVRCEVSPTKMFIIDAANFATGTRGGVLRSINGNFASIFKKAHCLWLPRYSTRLTGVICGPL
ncbi:hypothetical protein HD806DRAFT_53992 [Xylariaceae sp. AK1471]|nr:hypothetical protein HD806DRAFT_53992 [Xylariaceae sp. AK1471]